MKRSDLFVILIGLLGLTLFSSCSTPAGGDKNPPDLPEILPRNPDGTVNWEESERIAREIWEEANPPEPTPTPAPEVTPEPERAEPPSRGGRYSEEGSQRLLVKPGSDNTGNLVLLLPAWMNNRFEDAWIVGQDGRRHVDSGRRNINVNPDGTFPKNSNGNRRHLWYSLPGSEIGTGTLFVKLEGEEAPRAYPRNFAVRTEEVER